MRTDRLFDKEERSDQPKLVPQMEDNKEEQHRDFCGEIWASRKMSLNRNHCSSLWRVGAMHTEYSEGLIRVRT